MDLNSLISAIEILSNPSGRNQSDVMAAQTFLQDFKKANAHCLHEFFNLFTLE
jgi:hypothetical protein